MIVLNYLSTNQTPYPPRYRILGSYRLAGCGWQGWLRVLPHIPRRDSCAWTWRILQVTYVTLGARGYSSLVLSISLLHGAAFNKRPLPAWIPQCSAAISHIQTHCLGLSIHPPTNSSNPSITSTMEPTIIGSWSKRTARPVPRSSSDEETRPQKRSKRYRGTPEPSSGVGEGEYDKKCISAQTSLLFSTNLTPPPLQIPLTCSRSAMSSKSSNPTSAASTGPSKRSTRD